MSRWLSVSSHLLWPSRSNKPKGDFGRISVQGVFSWPGIFKVHRPSSLPEEWEPLEIMVASSFAELLIIFKSIITLSDQIDPGEIGKWCYSPI